MRAGGDSSTAPRRALLNAHSAATRADYKAQAKEQGSKRKEEINGNRLLLPLSRRSFGAQREAVCALPPRRCRRAQRDPPRRSPRCDRGALCPRFLLFMFPRHDGLIAPFSRVSLRRCGHTGRQRRASPAPLTLRRGSAPPALTLLTENISGQLHRGDKHVEPIVDGGASPQRAAVRHHWGRRGAKNPYCTLCGARAAAAVAWTRHTCRRAAVDATA